MTEARALRPSVYASLPFGRDAVIPVAVLIQGAALMATLVYAAFDSVSLIIAGGSAGAPLSVVGYGVVTLVIAIGLTIALPRVAPHSELAADPALVLLAVVVLAPVPWRLLRSGGGREILEAAPPPEVRRSIDAAVERTRGEFELGVPFVRATKLGRRLYLVELTTDPELAR